MHYNSSLDVNSEAIETVVKEEQSVKEESTDDEENDLIEIKREGDNLVSTNNSHTICQLDHTDKKKPINLFFLLLQMFLLSKDAKCQVKTSM